VRDITSERLSHYLKKLRNAGLAESTIGSQLAHLRAALSYAVEWASLASIPKLPLQQRAKPAKTMKCRPITTEEYERMLASVEAVVGPEAAPSWQRLHFTGLWLSGLRLGETIALYWDRGDCPDGKCLEVDLSGKRPMLVIPADLDKGNHERLLPIAPEFAEFLSAIPEAERTGQVFPLCPFGEVHLQSGNLTRQSGFFSTQEPSDGQSREGRETGNSSQVSGPFFGRGSRSSSLRIFLIVLCAMGRIRSFFSSPRMRLYPQPVFLAIRMTISRTDSKVLWRPIFFVCLPAFFSLTQRWYVRGWTIVIKWQTPGPIVVPSFRRCFRSSPVRKICFFGTRFRSISFSALRNSICLRRSFSVQRAKKNSNGWKSLAIELQSSMF
jgi:hypothetical protein